MKAHIVIKMYSTGTSYVQEVFSSKKKAQSYLDDIFKLDKPAGWTVTSEFDTFMRAEIYTMTPPSGNVDMIERYYIKSTDIH